MALILNADSVAFEDLEEIDRWALAELDNVTTKVLSAYGTYEFHAVYHALYNFATVTLSARYFDIIKDRLYTFAPHNKARRSAQTVLFRIADSLARLLAPILVFTADEIWENLAGRSESQPSVHMTEFPQASEHERAELLSNWERLFEIRDNVLRSLEEARIAKHIGSSLEAKVTLSASGSTLELLREYENELRYLFIVSQVEVTEARQRIEYIPFRRRKARSASDAGTTRHAWASRRSFQLFVSVAWPRLRKSNARSVNSASSRSLRLRVEMNLTVSLTQRRRVRRDAEICI